MIVTVAGSAVTFLPNDAEIGGISIQVAAFDGEIGTGQFPIPDPSSALTPVTGRQFKIAQDFALISDGLIIDYDTHRGPFRVGNQVEYPISVMDANALLGGFRVTRSRPSETDYARVIAFAALDIPTADTTWVLNSSTVTMPAKKYDGVGWADLINDIVEFTGKTLFVHDKATGGRCLHYHLLTAGHTCGLSISDVVTAQNGVTVFAPIDPLRQRTSVDLQNDVKGRSPAGKTYTAFDATSETAHDADGLKHEALIDFDTTTTADLTAKTNAFLASQKNDSDTWTCSIGPLDGTALGKMRVGDVMTVTSAAMGLSASPQRISHITYTVEPGAESQGYWYATLELGAPIRRRARVKPGPRLAALVRPYIVPFVPDMEMETAFAILYSPEGNDHFGFPPLIVYGSTGDAPSGGLPVVPLTGGLQYEALTNGFGTRQIGIHVLKRGTLTLYAKESYNWVIQSAQTITMSIIKSGVTQAFVSQTDGPFGSPSFAAGTLTTTATDIPVFVGDIIQVRTTWTGGVTPTIPNGVGVGGEELQVSGLTETGTILNTPQPGHLVTEQIVGDGVTTAFTANNPFAVNSLRVKVSGVAVVPTEVNGSLGTFTLPFAPGLGVPIIIEYLVADGAATGATNDPIPRSIQTYITPDLLGAGSAGLGLKALRDNQTFKQITADEVPITDAGGFYTGTDVEAALQEIGPTATLFFNVKAYGAVGDGVTDDTAAVQAALDAMIANLGGCTYFPATPDSYRISSTLNIHPAGGSNYGIITICGDSFSSTIKMVTTNTDLFSVDSNGDGTLFEDIYLEGPNSGTGVGISSAKDVNGRRLRIRLFNKGIVLGSGSFYADFQDCFFGENATVQVELTSGSNNAKFSDCYFAVGTIGIDVKGCEKTWIAGCSVEAFTTAGIRVNGGTNAAGTVITGVYFEQTNHPDILIGDVSAAHGVVLMGNTHIKASNAANPGWAVDAPNAQGLAIVGGYIDGSEAIRVDTSSGPVVITMPHRRHTGTVTVPAGSIILDPSITTNASAVGTASHGTSPYLAPIDHGHALGGTVGGDLSGTLPNPSVVDDSHNHTAATLPAAGASVSGGDHEHMIDIFNGDASTTVFEISDEPLDPTQVFAFVGGTWTAVTVSGTMNTTITFGSAPGSGTANVAIQYPAVAA